MNLFGFNFNSYKKDISLPPHNKCIFFPMRNDMVIRFILKKILNSQVIGTLQ